MDSELPTVKNKVILQHACDLFEVNFNSYTCLTGKFDAGGNPAMD